MRARGSTVTCIHVLGCVVLGGGLSGLEGWLSLCVFVLGYIVSCMCNWAGFVDGRHGNVFLEKQRSSSFIHRHTSYVSMCRGEKRSFALTVGAAAGGAVGAVPALQHGAVEVAVLR